VIVTSTEIAPLLKAGGLPQWKSSVILSCANPYLAMAKTSAEVSRRIHPHDHQLSPKNSRIHPKAEISARARIAEGVEIGANVVIEDDVSIASGVVLYPGVYIGRGCQIGEGSVLFPRVVLYANTIVGKGCRIHAGAVIGADGFGYAPAKSVETGKTTHHHKIFHLGAVRIEDEVEIGANTTIDRGTLGDTIVERGAKIDNQVQIGHNCHVGEGAIICGCAGMAGSSSVGKFTTLGAQSGLANQVHLGDYSSLAAYGGLAKDSGEGEELGGIPARPLKEYYRLLAVQQKLLKERSRGHSK
jgi:UDP-3-O-[3-hydroxymyristoyl] glucosamine N-acyltransferase